MKNLIYKPMAICLSFLMLISVLCGCGKDANKKIVTTVKYKEDAFDDEGTADGVVEKNNRFELCWNDLKKLVYITDNLTGQIYSTTPADAMETKFDEDGMMIKNNPIIDSPILVSYVSKKTLAENEILAYTEAISDGYVYTKKIKNGIRVIYDMINYKITVPVDYTIENDHFKISVDPKKITDTAENMVTAVSIAPAMFGIKNDTPDSWLFLPDGCGTLIEPNSIDLIGTKKSLPVYGKDPLIYDYNFKSYEKQINLPVFGMKMGNNAMLGILEDGVSGASLNLNIGSAQVKYSTIYPTFRIRGYNLIEAPSGFASKNIEIPVFDNQVINTKVSVSYYPLSGDSAGYVGMADVYRNYLEKEKGLKKSETPQKSATFRYLGGQIVKRFTFGIPYKTLLPTTTIANADEMTKYFNSELGNNIAVELVGFGESGVDEGKLAGGFKIAGKIGSKSEVKKYAEFCRDKNISLYADFDLIGYSKSGNGFTTGGDFAALPNGQSAYLFCYSNVSRNKWSSRYQLLERDKTVQASELLAKKLDKYSINAVALESLSKVCYSDYKTSRTIVGGEMAKDVKKVYSSLKKNGYTVLSGSANDYAAVVSDYITGVQLSSSEQRVSTADIPFYSMVFKGYIPMSSESINLTADSRKALLYCAESGIAPTYTLIYNYTNELASTKTSAFFGCNYDGLKDSIVTEVKELNKLMTKIADAKIINHTIAQNGLRITVYDNGVSVAVNYTDKVIDWNGNLIDSQRFFVSEGL